MLATASRSSDFVLLMTFDVRAWNETIGATISDGKAYLDVWPEWKQNISIHSRLG